MGAGEETADGTAVRVALWRAMHLLVDPPPHVLEDEIGLQLAAPDEGWRRRPDMDPDGTRPFRASIVARARFIEDLVVEAAGGGVGQYVLLGAGLDTFAQIELGPGIPDWLRFVPVDFESGSSWLERLVAAGLDLQRPAVVASTGVSMYITKEATAGFATSATYRRPILPGVTSRAGPTVFVRPRMQKSFWSRKVECFTTQQYFL